MGLTQANHDSSLPLPDFTVVILSDEQYRANALGLMTSFFRVGYYFLRYAINRYNVNACFFAMTSGPEENLLLPEKVRYLLDHDIEAADAWIVVAPAWLYMDDTFDMQYAKLKRYYLRALERFMVLKPGCSFLTIALATKLSKKNGVDAKKIIEDFRGLQPDGWTGSFEILDVPEYTSGLRKKLFGLVIQKLGLPSTKGDEAELVERLANSISFSCCC